MHSTPSDPSFLADGQGRRVAGRSRRGSRTNRALGAALLGVAVLAGCSAASSAAPGTSPDTSAPSTSANASGGATGAPSAFPVTLTDDEGTAVAIPSEPQRIVSLTPGTTEILFALGARERVVATDSASDYPPEAVPLPDVASFGGVDVEQVVGLQADLVIAGGNGYTPSDAIIRLRSLGMPVLVVYAPSVRAVEADVELVGRAVGRAAAATSLASAMQADIDALAAAVHALPKPRVFYEVDATREIYGPADASFLAEMVSLAGGAPVTSGSAASFQIPLERLIAADPEIIVLGDAAFGATPDLVAKRPAWGGLTAVRQGAVRAVDDKLITRPGPRLAEGLRSLILAIHPDARLP